MRLASGMCVAVLASVVAVTGAFGGSGATSAKPTLAVVVVGSGRVVSTPAGISCPGKCAAAFAAGARVLLTPSPRAGARFLRWGGDCTGARACRVRVSGLAAVAAQFVGSTTKPAPPPASAVEPGGYAGRSDTGYRLAFHVPAGAGSVLNFSLPQVRVDCAGGGAYSTPISILKTAIRPNRTFSAKTTMSGVISGAKARVTFSVTGRFQGRSSTGAATAAGVYRADIVFTDTPGRKCTSNDLPWTATRSLAAPRSSVEPGAYSGRSDTGYRLTFRVPAGAGSVLDFSLPQVRVDCAGGGAYSTPISILRATINGDRSFTGKTSQSGVVNGANATITFSVTGYFHGPDSAGAATAAGVYREDIVFTDTPGRTCTSNDLPWTAARTG